MSTELPTLSRAPVCPAALKIAGACRSQQGVVCRIMETDAQEDPGLDMSAGDLERVRELEGGVYLNLKSDPSTVTAFCHGDGIPVLTSDDHQGRASYTYCPTWQEARDRELAGEDTLYDPVVPEATSMGVSTDDAADPWAAARQGLDELAPPSSTSRALEAIAEQDPAGFDLLKLGGRV